MSVRTEDGLYFIVQGEDENEQYRELATSQFDSCPGCDSLESVGAINVMLDDVRFCVICYKCRWQTDGDTISDAINNWNRRAILVADLTAKLHKADGLANEVNILTRENKDLTAKLKLAERLFAESTIIEGKGWSISNNGNPAKLIALRQYDGDGNVLSYTHHDSVLEAFTALKQIGEQQGRNGHKMHCSKGEGSVTDCHICNPKGEQR